MGLSNLAAGAQGGNAFGCLTGAHVTTDLTLPDMVTASIRQRASDRLTLLGTVEWTNWSRVGAEAKFKNNCTGKVVDVFPLGYDDGWFFSAGTEYAWSAATTLRAGVGYEISPISDEVRNVALPDNDRIWLSVGASTKLTDRITVDLAYYASIREGFTDRDVCPGSDPPGGGSHAATSTSFPPASNIIGASWPPIWSR